MTTPNMALTLPVVSQTPGPTWASEINADLSLIDSHNHTSGNGALVPVTGLNINADLSLATNALTNVKRVGLLDQASLASLNSVYANNGDLWWYNGSGAAVQITSGGSVFVGGTGNIGGLPNGSAAVNYVNSTLSFDFFDSAGAAAGLTVGTVNCPSVIINSITVDRSSGTSPYTLSLPSAVPGSNSFVTCTTAGDLGYITQTNGIQRSMLVAVGQQIGTYTTSGPYSTGQSVLNPITITTTGRPLVIGIQGPRGQPSCIEINGSTAGNYYVDVGIYIDHSLPLPPGFTVGTYAYTTAGGYVPGVGDSIKVPVSSVHGVFSLPAGTYQLEVVIASPTGPGTPYITVNGQLYAYEL